MRVIAQCLFIALAFVAATAHGASPASLQVEARSAAVGGGVLVQDIGIESLGGVFTVLLERRRAVPCEVTETFTTGADNQKEIEIRLFRGVAKLARDAKALGRFAVSDLPRAPRGTVRVAVTISVGSDGTISLAAKEQAGRVVHLVRKGT